MAEPIRVLNLFTVMNRGGAETMAMNYYRHIDRTKVQFDFMVHREQRGMYDDEIEEMGGHIYRMMPLMPQNFHAYKKQIKTFFDEHPEYQIIHSNMSESGYFIFKEAAKRGIPVRICHAHSSPHEWDMKMIVRTYFKHQIRPYTTDMFACGHEAGIWLFGKRSSQNITIMRNAIDSRRYRYSVETAIKVRQEFGLKNELVVGHVGSFKSVKNHTFLLDIFYEVAKIRPEARLMLVGGGDGENAIRQKAVQMHLQGQVIFTGVRSDVHDLLQAMDVFVFPSLFEGLPVTLVEVQAAGLPVLISDRIPSECIQTKNLVTICSLKDSPTAWANKVIERAQEGHSDHTQEIVSNGYDIVNAAKWLQDFYLTKCTGKTI